MMHPAFPAGAWRKSSFSGSNGDCVEVAALPAAVGVRDSKNRDGAVLSVEPAQWQAFVAAVRSGDLR